MGNKEILLSYKTYEEFDKNRNKFTREDFKDAEVVKHICSLFPVGYAPKDMHREVKLPDE
jgi:hypothetical protein